MDERIRCAILIASDRAACSLRPDLTTPLLSQKVEELGLYIVDRVIVADDKVEIAARLTRWKDQGIELILVSGGTGPAPSDVTPEATLAVIERRVPGMEEEMRRASLEKTPFAMLSRGVVGIAAASLIVDLPGNPRGAVESLDVIAPALRHALELIRGDKPDN